MDRIFIILTNVLLSVAYNAQKLAPQCQKGKSPVSTMLMLIVLWSIYIIDSVDRDTMVVVLLQLDKYEVTYQLTFKH